MDFFSDVNGFYNTVGNNDGQLQASMNFADYLNSLELGIVPNVLPNHIHNFFSTRKNQ